MKRFLLLIVLICGFTIVFAQVVGPYNGTSYLTNITGPCNAATLGALGDNDLTTNGTYEISFGSTFSGIWASGLGYSDGPGADMLCVSLHTAEGWDVALRLSDGSTTATQLVDMTTVLDDITWTMYNCAGVPTSNWLYDRRIAEVDFANFTIPAGLTVIGAEFTLNYDNAGSSDPVGILLLTSTTTQSPGIIYNGPLCSGQTLNLDIVNTNSDMIFSWQGPNGFSSSQQNPSLSFTQVAAGVYTCVVTDTVTGDVFNLTITAEINPQPGGTINFSGDCAESPVLFSFSPSDAQLINSYLWNFGLGVPNSSGLATPTSTFVNGGNYAVTLDVTNSQGCTATIDTVISITTLPIASFTPSEIIGCAPLQVTFINNSENTSTSNWIFGNGQTAIVNDLSSQTQLYDATSIVTLVAFQGQCDDTATVAITVPNCGCTDPNALNFDPLATFENGACIYPVPKVETYNVFTPNGDGDNDLFFLTTTNTSNVEFTIINRWGTVMYEASGSNPVWDGKDNGVNAVEGVYFYKYKVTGISGEILEGHGFFELIR